MKGGPSRSGLVLALGAVALLTGAAPRPVGPRVRLEALRREEAGVNPPAPALVSERLEGIAAELAREGNLPEAIELLSEALARDPENGSALAGLIIAYLRNDDLEFADFYLEEATRTSGRNPPPEVYRTIGDLFESRHRLEEALTAWDYFRRLGGSDPAIDQKIERMRGELSVRQPQRLRTSDHFLVYTDASIPEAVGERIEEHLEQDFSRLAKVFDPIEQVGVQVVIVYDGRAYFSLVSIPTWVSGVFDGKIRVSLEAPARWSPELAAVLSHELTHAFLRAVSRGKAPAWLHEGLAQWFEGKRIPRGELRAWALRHEIRKPEEMELVLTRRKDRESARDVYVEALGLTEFLIEERGTGMVLCVIADLARGMPFEEALSHETGWSPGELIQKWRSAIQSVADRPVKRGRTGPGGR